MKSGKIPSTEESMAKFQGLVDNMETHPNVENVQAVITPLENLLRELKPESPSDQAKKTAYEWVLQKVVKPGFRLFKMKEERQERELMDQIRARMNEVKYSTKFIELRDRIDQALSLKDLQQLQQELREQGGNWPASNQESFKKLTSQLDERLHSFDPARPVTRQQGKIDIENYNERRRHLETVLRDQHSPDGLSVILTMCDSLISFCPIEKVAEMQSLRQEIVNRMPSQQEGNSQRMRPF